MSRFKLWTAALRVQVGLGVRLTRSPCRNFKFAESLVPLHCSGTGTVTTGMAACHWQPECNVLAITVPA